MREIIIANTMSEWAAGIEACEHNEALATAFQITDPTVASEAVTFDEPINDDFCIKSESPLYKALEEALSVAGKGDNIKYVEPGYVRIARNPFLWDEATGMHIDYWDAESKNPLSVWYGALGNVDATFLPLLPEELPSVHLRKRDQANPKAIEDKVLPERVAQYLTYTGIRKLINNERYQSLEGFLLPTGYKPLEAKKIRTTSGTLLAFSSSSNTETGRLAVGHQFVPLSNRVSYSI